LEEKWSYKSDVNVGVRWNIVVVADHTFLSSCLVDVVAEFPYLVVVGSCSATSYYCVLLLYIQSFITEIHSLKSIRILSYEFNYSK